MIQLSRIRSDFSFYGAGRWAGYGIVSAIAIFLAVLSFKADPKIMGFATVISLGLTFVLLCFVNIRIGFYMVIALGFIVADVERIFMDQYPLTSLVLAMPCLLICLVIFKEMSKKGLKWMPKHLIVYLYLLLTAYLLVEVFNPQMDSLLGWLSAFWQRLAYVFLLLVSCYIFKDLKSIRFFFKFFFIAIFITALYGCIQQWFGLSSFDQRWLDSDPRIAGLYSLPGSGLRKFSFLTDPANFGTFMAGGAVATLVSLMMGPFGKRNKVWLGISTAIIILGMSYSGTRTANFMLVGGLALYILMTIYQKKTQILAGVTGIIFLFVLYAPIYGNVTLNRFRSTFNGTPSENASYNVRLIHRSMMQPYMHRFPFGGGVNTAGVPGVKYNPHHFLAGFPPDGAYFGTALNTGWIGLALDCLFYFIILFYCIHYFYRCRSREVKTYSAAMAVLLFSLFLGSDAQFTVSSVPQSLIFIPLLAVIIKLHTFDEAELSKANL